MKQLSLSIFFSFITAITFSQSDSWIKAEVIMKAGSTKNGEVKIQKAGTKEVVKFRSDENSKGEKIERELIDRIIFTNSEGKTATYVFYKISKKNLEFLQLILEWDVTLLARDIRVGVGPGFIGAPSAGFSPDFSIKVGEINEFFAYRKGEEIATPIKKGGKNFKKLVKEYFNDCTPIVKGIDSGKYHKDNVVEFVKFYNSGCE